MRQLLHNPVLIVASASLFYFFMFLTRVMMSVMGPELSAAFSLNEQSLGFLSASFVLTYSLSQIPSGQLIDKYGARRVLLISTLGVMLGIFMFQAANNYIVALIARGLIGLCSGCAFIAPLSLTRQWLDEKYFSIAVGMIQMLGCVGAIASGRPMVQLIDNIGWQDATLLSGFFAAFLLALFYVVVFDKTTQETTSNSTGAFAEIISSPKYWLIGLVAMASWAPIGGFTELWGVPYLMQLQGVDSTYATSQLILTWISIALASPIFGYTAERISIKATVYFCYAIGMIATALVISGYVQTPMVVSVLLFLMGIASGGQPAAFGMINRVATDSQLATAIGFCNICVIAGAFIMQPLLGVLIDYAKVDGVATQMTYTIALTPILIALFAGLIANAVVKLNRSHS